MEYKSFISDDIEEYLAYKKRMVGEKTLRKLKYVLKSLDDFLMTYDVESIQKLTELMVLSWINSSAHNSSSQDRRYVIQVYNPFATYLRSIGKKAYIVEIKTSKKSYNPLIYTKLELASIIEASENLAIKENNEGNVAFSIYLKIAIVTGMRKGEILNLKVEHIDKTNKVLIVREGKNWKDRAIPLPYYIYTYIEGYVHNYLGNREGYIFSKDGKESYSYSWVFEHYEEVKKLMVMPDERSGQRNFHAIRHTFATNSLLQAVQSKKEISEYIPYLSTYMGHESLNETQNYLHLNVETNEAIENLMKNSNDDIYGEL